MYQKMLPSSTQKLTRQLTIFNSIKREGIKGFSLHCLAKKRQMRSVIGVAIMTLPIFTCWSKSNHDFIRLLLFSFIEAFILIEIWYSIVFNSFYSIGLWGVVLPRSIFLHCRCHFPMSNDLLVRTSQSLL